MLLKVVRICVIFCACACALSVTRCRAEESGHIKSIPFFHEIMAHADDLNLNAEQKSKLTEIGDASMPKSRQEWVKVKDNIQHILTKDQNEKMEGFYRKFKDERERDREREHHSDDNDDHK